MLIFPNCKINLGLNVIERRPDGFHTIETMFYPINWCDALEVIETKKSEKEFSFSFSGIEINGAPETNLIYKAWKLIRERKKIPSIKVHLHKNIPMGAGLGGGSSNAAQFINLINDMFCLDFSLEEKINMAAALGSDCSFFIKNKASFATGRGDQLSPLVCDLSAYYILVVYPNINSDTKQAYQGLTPKKPSQDLRTILNSYKVAEWKTILVNDFEASIFKKFPVIENLKELFYNSGAIYASMSGSGSSVFGIFSKEPKVELPVSYQHCLQKPYTKIL